MHGQGSRAANRTASPADVADWMRPLGMVLPRGNGVDVSTVPRVAETLSRGPFVSSIADSGDTVVI